MTLIALLAEIVGKLDAAGIPYMVAGSLASTRHGEPRSTQDIDLVIDPTAASLGRFVDSLDRRRFYVGDAAAALERRDQFNIVDVQGGWKVDLIIRKDREFSRTEFERRELSIMAGTSVAVATAEDTILAKLEWARTGGSDRQRRDAIGILATQGDALDLAYLRRWAEILGLASDLEAVLRDALPEGE